MSDRFAALALTLSGIAARHLGWRPDDFWRATPAELLATLGASSGLGELASLDRATLQRMMEQDHG